MKMYWLYFKAITRHKWYVFLECCKAGIPIRGLMHDMSKFSFREFDAYAKNFYGVTTRDNEKAVKHAFDAAWLYHQNFNKHHWQWWVLHFDDGGYRCLEMPERYRVEMVCDWIGAGRAYGNNNVLQWYSDNREKIQLHKRTRAAVEKAVGYVN